MQQKAQQADVLFFGVAHRADQRMQRGVQHRAFGAAQRFHRIAALHRRCLQQRGGLPCQPLVQFTHLPAQPGDGFFRRRVGVLQRRDRRVADAVAGIYILRVGFVLHIVLPKRRAVCLGLGARQAQKGPHIIPAPRRDAPQPVQAGTARHAEQDRFGLVGHRMRGSDQRFFLPGQVVEPAIPQPARPFFAGVCGDLNAFAHSVVDKQFHAVLAAEIFDEIGIRLGLCATQTMVDMGSQHFDLQFAAAAQQKQQQRHGICPAGAGRDHPVAGMEQALLAAVCQQGLLGLLDENVRIRSHGSHPNC